MQKLITTIKKAEFYRRPFIVNKVHLGVYVVSLFLVYTVPTAAKLTNDAINGQPNNGKTLLSQNSGIAGNVFGSFSSLPSEPDDSYAQPEPNAMIMLQGIIKNAVQNESRALLSVNGGPSMTLGVGDVITGNQKILAIDKRAITVNDNGVNTTITLSK